MVPPSTQPFVQASDLTGYSMGSGAFSSQTARVRSQVPPLLVGLDGRVLAHRRGSGETAGHVRDAGDDRYVVGAVATGRRTERHEREDRHGRAPRRRGSAPRVRLSSPDRFFPNARPSLGRSAYVAYAPRGRPRAEPLPTLAEVGHLGLPRVRCRGGFMSDMLDWRDLARSTLRRWWLPVALALVGAVLGVLRVHEPQPRLPVAGNGPRRAAGQHGDAEHDAPREREPGHLLRRPGPPGGRPGARYVSGWGCRCR